MTAFLVTVFISGLVLGLLRFGLLVAIPDKIPYPFAQAVSAIYWIGLSGWAMYWLVS
jgi:hypothetical protein